MHSNITSSYAYGIIKKNGFLTGEHGAGNLTVLVLILVLCLNRKTENAILYLLSVQIQAFLKPLIIITQKTFEWNLASFTRIISSFTQIAFGSQGSCGNCWSKKSQWRNVWPPPNFVLNKSERSPSHTVSKISAGGESRNHMWYQSLCQRHLVVPSPCTLALAQTHSFLGGGKVPSWSTPVNLSGFLSRLISLDDC